MSKNYLVSGGNGYIGSHMCKYLHKKGHKVYIIDNFSSSPKRPTHDYGEFIEGDIADAELLLKTFAKIKIEAVFHFAAKSLVSEGEARPLEYFYENTAKSIQFFQILAKLSIPKIIFSSTCATYGPCQNTEGVLSEEHPQNPQTAYGLSKWQMELTLKKLAQSGTFNVAILRYFNAAGCSPEGDLGELHEPETHLIPALVKTYLAKKEGALFKIFGNDYETPDGTCIRDYIHIEDLVEGHFLAYQKLERERLFTVNLGSGIGYSVGEVLKAFENLVGEKLKVEVSARRAGDPAKLIAETKKAQKTLGISLKKNLSDCLQDCLNFFLVRTK